MAKELVHWDPIAQKHEIWMEEDGQAVLYAEQDVEPVIDLARDLRDCGGNRQLDLRHVAEVPLVFVDQAMREGWYHDQAAWRRFLNEHQNRVFRIWEGRL